MVYKDFIIETLARASRIAHNYFGKISGLTKGWDNNQVLSKADIDIGKLIIDRITKYYPKDNIIDEETGVINNKSSVTWVLDPVDGTSNFVNGLPMYGIMIGILHEGIPLAGGIALPYFKETYYAQKNNGAFRNNEIIMVTKERELNKALVAYGIDSHRENPQFTINECQKLSNIILNIRNIRSSNSCFDGLMVASGKYGAYLSQSSKIWDNVALQVICEEAGATYTDYYGKKIDYTDPVTKDEKDYSLCIAPHPLHRKLQKVIHCQK